MQTLRLYVFLALIAVRRCYELSQNLAEFYCIFNGNFNDREQAEKAGVSESKIDAKFQPIFAPLLSQLPLLYVHEILSGKPERVMYGTVSQGDDGIIYLKQYNFTGNFQINPDTFDANQAKQFTWDDLHGNNCSTSFTRVQPFVFIMDWENCRENTVQGKRPAYVQIYTCKKVFMNMPVGAHEQATLVPYSFNWLGPKYPLENAPSNYVCNCDNAGN